jgi:hypothetical protein
LLRLEIFISFLIENHSKVNRNQIFVDLLGSIGFESR